MALKRSSSPTPAARERRQVQVPLLVITAAAWSILIIRPGGTALAGSCCVPPTVSDALSPDSLQHLMELNPPVALAQGWLLMLVAMMTPMLAAPIRHVIDRSFARRRRRAVALFVIGYITVWMFSGAILITLALAIGILVPNAFLAVTGGFAITLLWQSSPLKQRCLNRGHVHTELAAFGIAADRDALRFGVMHGLWCVGSCWALMLLPELFVRGHLPAMAVVTLWFFAERLDRPMPPAWRVRGFGKIGRVVVAQTRTLLQRR